MSSYIEPLQPQLGLPLLALEAKCVSTFSPSPELMLLTERLEGQVGGE